MRTACKSLAVLFRFVDGNWYDGVSGIAIFIEWWRISHSLKIKNVCCDFVNDNYQTYELCKKVSL